MLSNAVSAEEGTASNSRRSYEPYAVDRRLRRGCVAKRRFFAHGRLASTEHQPTESVPARSSQSNGPPRNRNRQGDGDRRGASQNSTSGCSWEDEYFLRRDADADLRAEPAAAFL